MCKTHNKEHWKEGTYIDNHDGTVSCESCPWGARIGGRYRVLFGKIVDLKDFSSQ